MRFLTSCILVIGSILGPSTPAQTSPDTTAALQADMQWLRLIDAGDFPAAWNSAAKSMQNAVPETEFARSVAGVRTPLGSLGTRTLSDVAVKTQLPGAPDGHYVVAQYTTTFANKAHAVETVVASQEPDGSWRVSGYFIR